MREEEGWGEMRGSIDREKEKKRERERERERERGKLCVCVCDRRKKERKKVGYTVDEGGDAEGELLEPVPV